MNAVFQSFSLFYRVRQNQNHKRSRDLFKCAIPTLIAASCMIKSRFLFKRVDYCRIAQFPAR